MFNLFRTPSRNTASIAKDRLKILVAYERDKNKNTNYPDYFPALRQEIIGVVGKYIQISSDQIKIDVDNQGSFSVLELNVPLPEK